MWINDKVYLKREVEVDILFKNKEVSTEATLYMELDVTGELNYSNNPEEYSIPDIEVNSLNLSVDSFHSENNIDSITIKDFITDIKVKTNSFDKVIEDYLITDLPELNVNYPLLSKNNIQIKYERKRA